jgi:hypothetical protein
MKATYAIGAVLAIAVAAPAIAADGDKDKAKDAPKEKKICRTERVTGSLVAQRRICMTKSEWDKLALETKKDVEDIQRNAGSIPRTPSQSPANQGGMTAGFQ